MTQVRQCAEPMTQLHRLKVRSWEGFTLQFRVCSISPEPFERFSLNITQMFLLVRRCAESMTQLCRLKVMVTLQGQGITIHFHVHSISPEPFERFSLYPPQTLFVVGYTVFTLSVHACLRASVTFCFFNNLKSLLDFHQTLQTCSYMQDKYVRQKSKG